MNPTSNEGDRLVSKQKIGSHFGDNGGDVVRAMKECCLSRKYMGVWRWVSRKMRSIMDKLPNRAIRKIRTTRMKKNRPIFDGGNNLNKMKSVDV